MLPARRLFSRKKCQAPVVSSRRTLRDKKESVSLVWAIREAECGDWEILTEENGNRRRGHRPGRGIPDEQRSTDETPELPVAVASPAHHPPEREYGAAVY